MLSILKNLFNFKKQDLPKNEQQDDQQPEESLIDDEIQSMVCYSSDKEGNVLIDIMLEDYSKESVSNFAKVICGICSFQFHIQTVEIIKNGFIDADKDEMFDFFLSEMIKVSKENLLKLKQESSGQSSEEPCVKPSDML
jgi:hypothetical protein